MSTSTVTFRLSSDDLAVLDSMVASGVSGDRTAALRRVLAHERRRMQADRDAQIYAALGTDPDLDYLAGWAGEQDLDLG